MSITLGVVEVPASPFGQGLHNLSTRKFGDKTLLEWVIRRVTESLLIEQVVVVASAAQQGSLRHLIPSDVLLYEGPQQDRLARFAAAVAKADASCVVRVPIDRPFIDPTLIDRLICDANVHPGCDYIGYTSSRDATVLTAQLGVFGEWCRGEALAQAERSARLAADRSHPTRYIYSRPDEFQLRLIPAPTNLDRNDIRLAIEDEEDWEHAHLIYDALGPDQLDWQRIASLLAHQPQLRRKMGDLNRSRIAST